MTQMRISVVSFNDGKFDVMIMDEHGREVTFSGEKTLTAEEFELVNRLAPACVWTKYTMDGGQ